MNFTYIPLLQTQRNLQGLPRNRARFQHYLRTMTGADSNRLALPSLVFINPMGKQHVTDLLDALLALDADGIASRALAEASAKVSSDAGDFKFALVIADDLKGGWTNRYDYEFNLRFGEDRARPGGPRPRWSKDDWLTGVLWSSEAASERAVREVVLTVVYRAAYVQRHGSARTLRDMLAQEGHVMAAAGCTGPGLDEEDIAYTCAVLAPLLEASDKRTAIECLFGDAAGRTLGFTPRGLSPWAGLALALFEAQASKPWPYPSRTQV